MTNLYTLIIVNKRTSEVLKNHRFLFDHFIDAGELEFCDWNEGGNDVNSTVPDLYKRIRGKKIWRAIIINTDSLFGYKSSPVPSRDNPFDYSGVDSETFPHESPIPLIRLTHLLGGYVSSPPTEFVQAYEFYDDQTGERMRMSESEFDASPYHDLLSKSELKSIFLEKKPSTEVVNAYREMSEKYALDAVRPSEILLVATRQKSEDNTRAKIMSAWQNHFEGGSSNFWERNKYPTECRFLFSEISKIDNALHAQDISCFWLSVLSLAVNHVSPSTLQAYRLYRLWVELDMSQLAESLSDHIDMMEAAYKYVKQQLGKLPDLNFETDEELLPVQVIPLAMTKKDDGAQYLDINGNSANQEAFGSYSAKQDELQKNLTNQAVNPRRAIDRAAKLVKTKSRGFYGEAYELDEYQMDDLREELNDYEMEIFTTRPKNAFSKEKTRETGDIVSNQIAKTVAPPMSTESIIIAGVIALILVCIGNIYYFKQSYEEGTLGWAVVLTLVVVAVTAIGGGIALKWHQNMMEERIRAATQPMRETVNEVHESNACFENYFTNVCTYMKGQSMLQGSRLCDDRSTSDRSRLNAHSRAIKSVMERDRVWLFDFDLVRCPEERKLNVSSLFDFHQPPEVNQFYRLPANSEPETMLVNTSGETCTAPYAFIQKLIIEREEVFDDMEV